MKTKTLIGIIIAIIVVVGIAALAIKTDIVAMPDGSALAEGKDFL